MGKSKTDKPRLGDEIRRVRREKARGDPAYTLRKVAKRVGISATYLSEIENNRKTPSTDVLRKIAQDLEIRLEWLAWLDDKLDTDILEWAKETPGVRMLLTYIRDNKIDPYDFLARRGVIICKK